MLSRSAARPSAFCVPYAAFALALMIHAPGAVAAVGADWPQFRADAARSGYTPGALPERLSLHWTYRPRHPPKPAWLGEDTRMPFDRAYQPVVAGGTLYFGTSADDRIHALDAATGKERWSFLTGAPVRFAPALWRDRLFVASDDGHLYCLDAATGKLLWQRRGGPDASMVLGNGRLVSRWPARGGPVVADDVVYWAAGIWPSEGIYVYALDASSGRVLWRNDDSGALVWDQPHPGARARSGISAQGYLSVCGDRLLVPTGRAVPAGLDRATGKFLYFHLQKYGKYGGAEVTAAGAFFLNGPQLFEAATGALRGSLPAGSVAAATPDGLIVVGRGLLSGFGLPDAAPAPIAAPPLGARWSRPLEVTDEAAPITAAIVVGSRVVLGGRGFVAVADGGSSPEKPGLRWSAKVEGNVHALAFAGGRLYASTDRGPIYCFGPATGAPGATIAPAPPSSPYDGAGAAAADEILRRTGVMDGYCVDLGCGDGALAYELARRTHLSIYALDPDPEKVALARARLTAAGLYGSRVVVHQGDIAQCPYPRYFADLVVSGRSVAEGGDAVPAAQAERLKRPEGGWVCVGRPGAMQANRRGPIEGAGAWTHQYCDAAGTACSTDARARSPLRMLWFTDYPEVQMPNRHGRGPAPLYAGGRLFALGRDALHAVDAYNGRYLWGHPLPDVLKPYDQEHLAGAAATGSRFCLGDDSLYVAVRQECIRVDAATGRKVRAFPAPPRPDGKPGRWGYLAFADGTLFGTAADEEQIVAWTWSKKATMDDLLSESRALLALDPDTGSTRWTYRARHSIRHNAIAIGGGRVYLIDRPAALTDRLDLHQPSAPGSGKLVLKEKLPAQPPGELVALDAATGRVLWRAGEDVFGTLLALSVAHDVLVMSYQSTRFKLKSELGGKMAGYRASDGKRLWLTTASYISRPILNDRTLYAQPGAWDLLTGEPRPFTLSRSYGCGIPSGSQHLLLFRSATLGYRDLSRAETENYGGIRPGCWINTIAAGGLVLLPDATSACKCSYLNKASVALQPPE